MSEHSEILADTVDRLFRDIAESGQAAPNAWRSIEDMGIPALFLPAEDGGIEGDWCDAEAVFRSSGYHALPLPVGETMIARKLLSAAGLGLPDGVIAFGRGRGRIAPSGTFTGSIRAQTCSPAGSQLLATVGGDGDPTACVLIDPVLAHNSQGSVNAAGEPRDSFDFTDVTVRLVEGIDGHTISALGAFLRTAQIGGALSACLELCIRYAQERSQFGRELRKFQAIQHQIALLAEEAAAVASASASAAAALDRGKAEFEIACAKLRANQATGASALISHQVHGAIGITDEYGLHRFTRRLWAWRSEFGNDRYWAQRLGHFMLSNEASSPWLLMTGQRGVETTGVMR